MKTANHEVAARTNVHSAMGAIRWRGGRHPKAQIPFLCDEGVASVEAYVDTRRGGLGLPS